MFRQNSRDKHCWLFFVNSESEEKQKKMSLACLQRLNCCRSTDEETGKRPEIVVISTQPDKDNASIPESFGDSGVSLRGHGKYTKAGSRGSVSEEDSGVGSEGHNQSDIADQTDTSSQADESQPGTLRRSESNLSEFGNILPICENQDLTAEIAEELKMMNGFSLEDDGIELGWATLDINAVSN